MTTPGKHWGLRRLADESGRFKMLAVDQRPPIKDLVRRARLTEQATYDDVANVKFLLLETLAPQASAVLVDPHFSFPAGLRSVSAHQGLLLTLEDSQFEETESGRRSRTIDHWSVDQIKRAGADAVKLLAWYRPDADAATNEHQQAFVSSVGEECRRFDIPFLFELLLYSFPHETNHTTAYTEQPSKRADHLIESIETFAHPSFGVDVFKLESPLVGTAIPDPEGTDTTAIAQAHSLFRQMDAASNVPWVMLSAGVNKEAFTRILHFAYEAGASGYLAGRAIWWDELLAFPDMTSARRDLLSTSAGYMQELNSMTDHKARPFTKHRHYGSGRHPTEDLAQWRLSYERML